MSGQVIAGWVPFRHRLADGQPISDPTRPRLDLGLSTVAVGFSRGEGPGLEVQLPAGFIVRADDLGPARTDVGVGDLEVRGKGAVGLGAFRLSAAAGAALPTGPYAARSGQVGFDENASYLTLGRGTAWFLFDLDARLALPRKVGLFASATVRASLKDARDGFRWGPELRATVGASAGPLWDVLTASVGLETQGRAVSSEVDLFTGARVASANTGGTWLTLVPSVQARLTDGLAAFGAARIPLTQWATGLQFVPSPGVFLGIGGTLEVVRPAPHAPAPIARARVGKVTLVDYWASWCAPCVKLKPLLAAARDAHPDVVLEEVDASAWDGDVLAAQTGAAGLPVLEVYRRDGSLAARLVGEDVFGFHAVLEEVLK